MPTTLFSVVIERSINAHTQFHGIATCRTQNYTITIPIIPSPDPMITVHPDASETSELIEFPSRSTEVLALSPSYSEIKMSKNKSKGKKNKKARSRTSKVTESIAPTEANSPTDDSPAGTSRQSISSADDLFTRLPRLKSKIRINIHEERSQPILEMFLLVMMVLFLFVVCSHIVARHSSTVTQMVNIVVLHVDVDMCNETFPSIL
ncbi:hypothetical protein Bpfe_019044 [Biomphalaria pfeifferi]|uniref:Uncharacterized protein n=1 Tax=Biomphalaria pfeifferi TaxID=112525 RepID=A0AAD8BDK4_BIOPF|nr:hypothetical protein Bpfe_019044 [Biomphalaria pfeifferi]